MAQSKNNNSEIQVVDLLISTNYIYYYETLGTKSSIYK